jgi:hypothetical protein
MHERPFTRAAGVSPPWFGNRTGNGERVLPTVDAHMPRGAYAPRSCVAVRMSVDKKRFLRCTYERSQERRVSARRGSGQSNVVLGMPQISCKRVFEATVGSRRPLLGGCVAAAGNVRSYLDDVLFFTVGSRRPLLLHDATPRHALR